MLRVPLDESRAAISVALSARGIVSELPSMRPMVVMGLSMVPLWDVLMI
jgi:hypothetical protein